MSGRCICDTLHMSQVLHHMRTLERHPIMKIIREFEKKEDQEKSK
jgi:hypothetical protein